MDIGAESDIYPDTLLNSPPPDARWWAAYTFACREKVFMQRLQRFKVPFAKTATGAGLQQAANLPPPSSNAIDAVFQNLGYQIDGDLNAASAAEQASFAVANNSYQDQMTRVGLGFAAAKRARWIWRMPTRWACRRAWRGCFAAAAEMENKATVLNNAKRAEQQAFLQKTGRMPRSGPPSGR